MALTEAEAAKFIRRQGYDIGKVWKVLDPLPNGEIEVLFVGKFTGNDRIGLHADANKGPLTAYFRDAESEPTIAEGW